MSDIKGLREISNDPFGKLLTSLSKKFSAFLAKDQAELVENPEDVYADGQDVESALKYHNFVMSKKFDLETTYYSSADPDFSNLRLWIIGRSLGNFLVDYSGYDRTVNLYGDPILVDGAPLDWGISDSDTKSVALRFNRPMSDLENRDDIKVDNHTLIRVAESLTTGISFFIRFRIFDLSTQGGTYRHLFEKSDTSGPNDAIRVFIKDNGRLTVYFKRAGTSYAWETAVGTIATDTVYDVWITYAVSGNVFHIYVNNVDKTLTSAGTVSWASDSNNHDLYLMRMGAGDYFGHFYGDLYDFRLYREKVVPASQVGYHYTNKWTIANIPFGQVSISNYACSVVGAGGGGGPGAGSFDSGSFDSGSFD